MMNRSIRIVENLRCGSWWVRQVSPPFLWELLDVPPYFSQWAPVPKASLFANLLFLILNQIALVFFSMSPILSFYYSFFYSYWAPNPLFSFFPLLHFSLVGSKPIKYLLSSFFHYCFFSLVGSKPFKYLLKSRLQFSKEKKKKKIISQIQNPTLNLISLITCDY